MILEKYDILKCKMYCSRHENMLQLNGYFCWHKLKYYKLVIDIVQPLRGVFGLLTLFVFVFYAGCTHEFSKVSFWGTENCRQPNPQRGTVHTSMSKTKIVFCFWCQSHASNQTPWHKSLIEASHMMQIPTWTGVWHAPSTMYKTMWHEKNPRLKGFIWN